MFWGFDFPFDKESDRERHGVYRLVLNGEITAKLEHRYPNFVIRANEYSCKRYLTVLWFDFMPFYLFHFFIG